MWVIISSIVQNRNCYFIFTISFSFLDSVVWAEDHLVVTIDTLISTLVIIELPAVGIRTLVLEDVIIPVVIFRRFWPVLHIAPASNVCSGIERRAAVV